MQYTNLAGRCLSVLTPSGAYRYGKGMYQVRDAKITEMALRCDFSSKLAIKLESQISESCGQMDG